MFKNGRSIKEISKERDLTLSTIEGHLATFIKTGELSIDNFLSAADLNLLIPEFEKYSENQIPAFKSSFEKFNKKYSYGQLKMAFNHILYLKNIQ
jgi:uncharacterized protein YpbB